MVQHATGKSVPVKTDRLLIVNEAQHGIYTLESESTELAFLDPPFNTGKNFRDYPDSVSRAEWLGMMEDVLMGVRTALTPTGSVWVNLDEGEHAHCRILLDRLFGEECHVATICWRKKYKASQARGIHTVHNPILVYGKWPNWQRKRGLPPAAAHRAKYRNPDMDPHGPWRLTHAGQRTYLADLIERGAMPDTWWDYDAAGYTELAVKEVRAATGREFSTPKPLALLRRIIEVASDPGDLVVDPFTGSGTTLVAAEELGRRWVGIEKSPDTVRDFIIPRLDAVKAAYLIQGL